MKILKILYFYYYSFYQKVDDTPHFTTLFSLSFSQSLLIIFTVQMIFAYFFCYFFSTWPMIAICVMLFIVNYFLFMRSGLARKIVKSTPPVIVNQNFTKWFAILFFIITFSFLFLTPILTKSIFANCR